MKFISDFDFSGKKVLLRADLNSDVVNGKVLPSERIKESAKTIKKLKKLKAKIVVIAHQGREGKEDFISLKQHSKQLNKFTKIKFVEDIFGDKAKKEILNLKSGEALLLENIRFEKDEFKPGVKNNKIIKNLVPLFDIYVNDAFSVCHRNQTSIVSFPKYLPSCAGLLLEKELKALKKIKLKKALFILGGAKPKDNIKLINKNNVLTCGLFGQICLVSKGKKLGKQEDYLKKEIKDFEKIKNFLKKKIKKIKTPVDFAVKIKNKRKELELSEFPSNYEIYDIGSKTIREYTKIIKNSKMIYMKGPAGFCADKKFCKGTISLLKAIADNKGFSLIGGGHLSEAIKKSKIPKRKFGHISLSGGALVSYLANEKLPGIEVLK